MADVLPFLTAADVRKKYPSMWNITTGKGYQISKKSYGPFIATVFHMYGQEIRWRVKELKVHMDGKGEFTKSFEIRGAGRGKSLYAARTHIEDTLMPRFLSIHFRRNPELAKEVMENVG